MDDELEIPAAEETEEELDLNEENEEEIDWKAKAEEERAAREKAEKAFQDQQKRAEIAEKKSKQAPKPATPDLSSTDLIAIVRANVSDEDLPEVQDYAKLKNISVAEALKTNFVKGLLADAAEIRKTAEATSTGTARRTAPRVSSEAILEKAAKGELPEGDSDIERLAAARMEAKKVAQS